MRQNTLSLKKFINNYDITKNTTFEEIFEKFEKKMMKMKI